MIRVVFEVYFGSAAARFLKKADKALYVRLVEKIRSLSTDPFPHDAKRILGQNEKVFRVRLGDFRILYVFYLQKRELLVVNIDKRPKVYK